MKKSEQEKTVATEAYSSGPTFTATNAGTKQQPQEGSAPPAVPAQLLTFLPESQYKHLGADKGPTVHLKGFAGRINFEDPTTAALATKLVHWFLEINPSRVCWDGDELSNDSFTALISRIHKELPDGVELVAFRRQEDRDTFDASWKNAQLPISVFLCDDALNWQQLGTHALSVTGAKSVGCLGGGGTIRDEFANRPTDDVKFTMFAITRLSAAGDVVEQAVLQDTKDPFIEVVH